MRIQPVEKEQAPEPVKRIYEALERDGGRVSNFLKMLAHKPDVLRTFNLLYAAVWAEGAVSPKLKELAYLRTSIVNGCEY